MTVSRPGDDGLMITAQNPLAYYLDERNPRDLIPKTSSPGLSRGSTGLCIIPPLLLRDISALKGGDVGNAGRGGKKGGGFCHPSRQNYACHELSGNYPEITQKRLNPAKHIGMFDTKTQKLRRKPGKEVDNTEPNSASNCLFSFFLQLGYDIG